MGAAEEYCMKLIMTGVDDPQIISHGHSEQTSLLESTLKVNLLPTENATCCVTDGINYEVNNTSLYSMKIKRVAGTRASNMFERCILIAVKSQTSVE